MSKISITIKPNRRIFNKNEIINVRASCDAEKINTGYLWYFCREDEDEELDRILLKFYKGKNVKVSKDTKGLTEEIFKGKTIEIPTQLFRKGIYSLTVDLLKNYEINKNRSFEKVPDKDIIGTYEDEINFVIQ